MSTLKAFLKDVPVEWKALGELAILKRGRVMSKNYLIENIGSYPVYSSQTANDGKIGEIKTFDFEGEFLTWTTDGANAGTIFYRQGKFSITNVCGLVEIKAPTSLSYKFLYYWLNIESKNHVYAGMGNPKLMSHQMEKIQIPIPYPNDPEKSLAVQQEIVRVLDGLSEQSKALTSALAQEIDQRKKQYEYYREELFRFEGKEVEWKSLGDVTEINTGGKPPIISDIQTQFEYINAGTTNSGYCHDYNCNGDIVTTPSRGQGGIGFIGYQLEKFWLGPLCYKINSKDNKKLLNKYIYYLLSSFRKLILELKKEGGVPAVNKSDLA